MRIENGFREELGIMKTFGYLVGAKASIQF